MTTQNSHLQTAKKAIGALKEYTKDLEGWNLVQDKSGVKVYNKNDGSRFSLLRGETVLNGPFTIDQVAKVAAYPGCRKIWDERFDTAQVKQFYDLCFTLCWTKTKAPWPVSPRDMATVFYSERTSDSIYFVLKSVKDPLIPEVSGCVRCDLIISGWKITKTNTGITLSTVTKIDLAGSISTSLLKSTYLQIPLCAGTVAKYLKEHGSPPVQKECTATIVSETFNHSKKEYVIQWSGQGNARYEIPRSMYPSGVKVKITGKAAFENKGEQVIITGINGSTTMKLTKV